MAGAGAGREDFFGRFFDIIDPIVARHLAEKGF